MKNISAVFDIPINNLIHHPDNPRKDLGDLEELTDSIKENGVMQNLTIVPELEENETIWAESIGSGLEKEELEDLITEDERFFVLIGNRRFEAALSAGLEYLPARIATGLSKADQIGVMLEENMQRNDLTIPEQAYGFQRLIDLGESIDSVADKSGFSKSTIYHRLNIAKLDKELVEEAIDSYQLTINDFTKLESVSDIEKRNQILKTSPRNISYAVDTALREENNEKWKRDVLSTLRESFIVHEFPEDARTYDPGREKKASLRYGEEPDFSAFEKDDIYYSSTWPGLNLYQYDEEAKEAAEFRNLETRRQNEQAQKNREALENIYERLKESIFDYFSFLIRQKNNENSKPDSDSDDVKKMLVFLLDCKAFNLCSDTLDWLELQAVSMEDFKALPANLQLAIYMIDHVFNWGSPVLYSGGFNEDKAEEVKDAVKIFEDIFGFEMENVEETTKLLNGTHPLYKK